MNPYLISATTKAWYDYFSSAVVVAKTEEDAKKIHPGSPTYTWNNGIDSWVDSPDKVTAKLIGVAEESLTEGEVLCYDFYGA